MNKLSRKVLETNIYQRSDNRIEGRVKVATGKKGKTNTKYHSVYGRTLEEVKEKMKAVEAKLEAKANPFITESKDTVSSWAFIWLNDIIRITVKDSTLVDYANKITNHIVPGLGKIRLSELTIHDIQLFVNNLTDKGMAPSTVRSIYSLLKSCLKKAVEWEKLMKNPAEGVSLPPLRGGKPHAFSILEKLKLFNVAIEDNFGAGIILALSTGMRKGEISALRWENVDFEQRLIHVVETMMRIQVELPDGKQVTEIAIRAPKSEKGKRALPMTDEMYDYLKKLKKSSKSEYVIYCKDGKFAEPRVLEYRYKELLKKAGLAEVKFHTMRHTFATRLIEEGHDMRSVSELMGHASIRTTMEYYADSSLEQRRKVMSSRDSLFEGVKK